MMRIIKKIVKKLKPLQKDDFLYPIKGKNNTLTITLPFDHKLPVYQSQFKLYDKKLIKLVVLVYRKKGGTCIDIGANVGDSAVAIRASSDISLICVEGDPGFYSYLEKNTGNLAGIKLMNAFVGGESKQVTASLVKSNGTGKIVSGKETDSIIKFLTLSQISDHFSLNSKDISFIKIDTDGYDFDIILGNIDFICASNTNLFFEYEINSRESHIKSLKCIEILSQVNYKFVVYDNFGNFMTGVDSDFLNRFNEINTFITSSKNNGGGIYYTDVFATNDPELYKEVYEIENKISFADSN